MSAMSEIRAKYEYCIEQARTAPNEATKAYWWRLAEAWGVVGIMTYEIISEPVQDLLNDSCEALIRFYSEIMDKQEPNPTYVEAHRQNMIEAYKEYQVKADVFTAGLIQTLCCTIVAMANEGEDDE